MPKRLAPQSCPLCGAPVRAGAGTGLEALGRHFADCPKTDRTGRAAVDPE